MDIISSCCSRRLVKGNGPALRVHITRAAPNILVCGKSLCLPIGCYVLMWTIVQLIIYFCVWGRVTYDREITTLT